MDLWNCSFPEPQRISTQDMFLAVGIWSVILSLLPVIVVYVLMVA